MDNRDYRGTGLAEIISNRIKDEGPLTFEQFMEMALYYPELGYYTSSREKIGAGGDYYTGPEVHPIFARTVAGQYYEMWERLGKPGCWQIVEYGAGKGLMARDALLHLREKYPDCFAGVIYCIIEASPSFIQRQHTVLREAGLIDKARWTGSLSCAHSGEGICGVIFSNELVDALPFHRVRAAAQGLQEIYVDWRDGEFVDVFGPLSTPELARYFEEEGVLLAEGQKAEVNLNARRWLEEVAGNLGRGFVVTVDYGATSPELYAASRFEGTARSFKRHRLVENPYEAAGEQDITASVNFSSLVRWSEKCGLKCAGFVSQADFLVNAGILELAGGKDDYTYSREKHRLAEAVKKLILPGGMGQVFKVLIQYKGFTETPSLKGTAGKFRRAGADKSRLRM